MHRLGMFDPDTRIDQRTTIDNGSPARTPLRAALRSLKRGEEEAPPSTPGERFLGRLMWGGLLLSFMCVGLYVANMAYVASAGPGIALNPTAWVNSPGGWRKIEDRVVEIVPGFMAGTYGVLTEDNEVYYATEWNTQPEVFREIELLYVKQSLPSGSRVILVGGASP